MRCIYVSAGQELEEEGETAVEAQQNGVDGLDVQTQMTAFEINLKDKRFVAAPNESGRACRIFAFMHLWGNGFTLTELVHDLYLNFR